MQVLVTHRLFLDRLEYRDAELILALRSDPLVNKFLDRTPTQTIDEAIDFIEKIKNGYSSKDFFYWVIRNEKNGPLLGTIGLRNFSEDGKSAELGYEMRPLFQGKGYMIEAVKTILHYAFEEISLKKITASTHKENEGSSRLLLKAGFKGLFDQPTDTLSEEIFFIRENPSL